MTEGQNLEALRIEIGFLRERIADLRTVQTDHIKEMCGTLQALENRISEREQERATEERKRLIAGVLFLGSIVMALFGVIWAFRQAIIGGGPAP